MVGVGRSRAVRVRVKEWAGLRWWGLDLRDSRCGVIGLGSGSNVGGVWGGRGFKSNGLGVWGWWGSGMVGV